MIREDIVMFKANTIFLLFLSMPMCVSAASYDEMKAINDSQKVGMTIVCKNIVDVPVDNGKSIVKVENVVRGLVKKNTLDTVVYDVNYSSSYKETRTVYAIQKFELTTSLENNRQKSEINPDTIQVTFIGEKSSDESTYINYIKNNNIQYVNLDRYTVTKFPFYIEMPEKSSGEFHKTFCGPDN